MPALSPSWSSLWRPCAKNLVISWKILVFRLKSVTCVQCPGCLWWQTCSIPKPWLGSWAPNGLWSSKLTSSALLICQVWEGLQRRWKSSCLVGWKDADLFKSVIFDEVCTGSFIMSPWPWDISFLPTWTLAPVSHCLPLHTYWYHCYLEAILWGLILNLCCLSPGVWLVNVWELPPTLTLSSVAPPLEPVIEDKDSLMLEILRFLRVREFLPSEAWRWWQIPWSWRGITSVGEPLWVLRTNLDLERDGSKCP